MNNPPKNPPKNPPENPPAIPVISTGLILLDADLGSDKEAVIRRLAALVADAGRADDGESLLEAALAREAQSATGLPGGIAIPHCRSEAVQEASIAFARLRPRVDFGAADGPADLVFLIAAPQAAGAEHMKLLSSLARALVRPDFVASLRHARTDSDVVRLVEDVLAGPAAPAALDGFAGRAQGPGAAEQCSGGLRHPPEMAGRGFRQDRAAGRRRADDRRDGRGLCARAGTRRGPAG